MKRKAKAQLSIMLNIEEKIRNEEDKYKETKEEEMNLEQEEEKVNNNLSNNINEIGMDPLDEYM